MEKLLLEMSWKQFLGWLSYFELEPFGEERNDLRSAQICCMIAEPNRDRSKKPTPFEPSDFMFKFGESDSKLRSRSSKSAVGGERKPLDAKGFKKALNTLMGTYGHKSKSS